MNILIRKIYKKLKGYFYNSIKFKHLKIGLKCKTKWYGNQYGGFNLNPNLLNKNSIVYSFGIGEDISFDKALIDNHNCNVYGFDPTPKSIDWCSKQTLPENFHLFKFGISVKTGKVNFHLPKNNQHVSGSLILQNNVSEDCVVEVEMKSFDEILKILEHDKIDVLKMDIEGSEYDVIENILKTGIEINQMAIELHERFFKNGKEKSIELINILNNYGYEIFAISNTYEEISFIRKKAL
ncbi:FkbM family methyltransferase [Polaribacter haliotis]|uniref:FkbM family methyltransferase n=1 Tax=Polaribacter haliotis TaxID=1888915 RepID=A0A7L8AJ55_9FLAO|nr:FkbM family methyltransferase [Polaribacter haliotis]QOD62041.1 FkbM family methyltransferase [Polaribacter haliotis]